MFVFGLRKRTLFCAGNKSHHFLFINNRGDYSISLHSVYPWRVKGKGGAGMKKLGANEMRKIEGGLLRCKTCGGTWLNPLHLFTWKHQKAVYYNLF